MKQNLNVKQEAKSELIKTTCFWSGVTHTKKLLCQAGMELLEKFIYVICLMARWRTGCLGGCLIINLGNICYDLWVMGKGKEGKYKKRQVEWFFH